MIVLRTDKRHDCVVYVGLQFEDVRVLREALEKAELDLGYKPGCHKAAHVESLYELLFEFEHRLGKALGVDVDERRAVLP
jgi:hypothetical protein